MVKIPRQLKTVLLLIVCIVGIGFLVFVFLSSIGKHSINKLPDINAVILTPEYSSGKKYLLAYDCHGASLWRKQASLDELHSLHMKCYQPNSSTIQSTVLHSKKLYDGLDRQPNYGLDCFKNEIFILTEDNQGYLLRCFDDKGELKKNVHFALPCKLKNVGCWPAIEVNESRIAIATTGKKTGVFLLDRDGAIIRFIEHAYNPQFSSDGLQMIYVECKSKASQRCRIVLYDLKSNSTKANLPVNFSIMQSFLAPDGNSMIALRLTRGLAIRIDTYAIDLRKDHFSVYKLPIKVQPSEWTVIDSVPKSFKRATN